MTIARYFSLVSGAYFLLLALILRTYGINATALSSDESFSWRLTQYDTQRLLRHAAEDVHPPLYYMLLKGWVTAFGTSLGTLRGFSILCGTLAVVFAVLLGLEARHPLVPTGVPPITAGGSLFAAFLAATHLAQVTPGRDARMYALGVLLTCVTSWLLLRALRASEARNGWIFYGLATAAFCYTHAYAFFTVLAQTLFVLGMLVQVQRRNSRREALAVARGFLLAGSLAFLLYAPWIPTLWFQLQSVRQSYWIAEPTRAGVERLLFTWAAGWEHEGFLETRLWLTLAVIPLAWALWRGPAAAWLMLLLAATPWACALLFSTLSGRPILMDRYLAFAHVGLLDLWGVAWNCLPGWPERLILAALIATPSMWGSVTVLSRLPDGPPAIQNAAQFLCEKAEADDVILLTNAQQLNRLRYYTSRCGAVSLDLRCPHRDTSQGHVVHYASLQGQDIFVSEEELSRTVRTRIWRAEESRPLSSRPPPQLTLVLSKTFEGDGTTRYTLELYQKVPPNPLAGAAEAIPAAPGLRSPVSK